MKVTITGPPSLFEFGDLDPGVAFEHLGQAYLKLSDSPSYALALLDEGTGGMTIQNFVPEAPVTRLFDITAITLSPQ